MRFLLRFGAASLLALGVCLAGAQLLIRIDNTRARADLARAELALTRAQLYAVTVSHNQLAARSGAMYAAVHEQLEACRVRTANLRTVAETLILSSTTFPERKQLPNTPGWPAWPVKENSP